MARELSRETWPLCVPGLSCDSKRSAKEYLPSSICRDYRFVTVKEKVLDLGGEHSCRVGLMTQGLLLPPPPPPFLPFLHGAPLLGIEDIEGRMNLHPGEYLRP